MLDYSRDEIRVLPFALSATAINEHESGAIVGDLTTTDEDANDTHTYTLTGADADSFEIVNGQLKLKDSVSANYEEKNSYSVTVTATDSGGLSISSDYTVTINDVNDAPSAINTKHHDPIHQFIVFSSSSKFPLVLPDYRYITFYLYLHSHFTHMTRAMLGKPSKWKLVIPVTSWPEKKTHPLVP